MRKAEREHVTTELTYLTHEAKNGQLPIPLVHARIDAFARYLLVADPTVTNNAWTTINSLRTFLDGAPK